MIAVKQNIRHLGMEELLTYFESIGEKKFRSRQVYEWLWKKNAQSFDDMSDLSKELRNTLSEKFDLPALRVNTTQHSTDGTIKSRFMTFDGHMIEGVLIPTEKRNTACQHTLCFNWYRVTVVWLVWIQRWKCAFGQQPAQRREPCGQRVCGDALCFGRCGDVVVAV